MNIVIVAAMEQEAEFLKKSLRNFKTKKFANQSFFEGTYGKHNVIIVQSGIGKVNATINTTTAIIRFVPKAIINTGTAGALGDFLRQGDVVIANGVAHHDVDVTAFGYEHGQVPQQEPRFCCDKNLLQIALKASRECERLKTYEGLLTSGDQFISSNEQKKSIRRNFPEALAVEMEAAAIAQTCKNFNIPFISIRAISDLANGEAPLSFNEFLPKAAENSARLILKLLDNYEESASEAKI